MFNIGLSFSYSSFPVCNGAAREHGGAPDPAGDAPRHHDRHGRAQPPRQLHHHPLHPSLQGPGPEAGGGGGGEAGPREARQGDSGHRVQQGAGRGLPVTLLRPEMEGKQILLEGKQILLRTRI